LGAGRGTRRSTNVYDRHARSTGEFSLISIDRDSHEGSGRASNAWREWLMTNNRCTPAAEAAFRLDFNE
jgi:hypothetical protein